MWDAQTRLKDVKLQDKPTKTFEPGHKISKNMSFYTNRLSPRARNRFNRVVEAKRFEGVFLCRKLC